MKSSSSFSEAVINQINYLHDQLKKQMNAYRDRQIEITHDRVMKFFECLFWGDSKIKKLKQLPLSILMVGQTRTGKSTLFNYLRDCKLIPVLENFKVRYEVDRFDDNGILRHLIHESVTLIPNIEVVKYKGNQVSLADMAGYCDQGRGFEGVFSVSYMLSKCFNFMTQGLFLLCVDAQTLTVENLNTLKKPFENFIEMFNEQYILNNPEIRKRIFKSVCLMTTKADPETSQEKYLDMIRLLESGLKYKKKTRDILVRELVNQIIEDKSIVKFDAAEIGNTPPNCQLLQSLATKKWEPFSFNEGERVEDIVQLPFKQQKSKLEEDEEKSFNNICHQKIDGLVEFFKILHSLLNKVQNNWKKAPDLNFEIQMLKNLQVQHDEYNITFDQKLDYLRLQIGTEERCHAEGIQLFQVFETLNTIQNDINRIANSHQEIGDKIAQLENPLHSLLDIIRKKFFNNRFFNLTQEEANNFITSMFLMERGLYQCKSINEIAPEYGSQAYCKIVQGLKEIITQDINKIEADFLAKYDPEQTDILVFTQRLEDFLKERLEKLPRKGRRQAEKSLKYKSIKLMNMWGQHCHSNEDYCGAINSFMRAWRACQNFKVQITTLQGEVEELDWKRINYYLKKNLMALGLNLEANESNDLALRLYSDIRCVKRSRLCYERIIDQVKLSAEAKYSYMRDYADFLKDHGFFEKAHQVYLSILDQFFYMPSKLGVISDSIRDCINQVRGEELNNYLNDLDNQQFIVQEELIERIIGQARTRKQKTDQSQRSEAEEDVFERNQAVAQ